MKWTIIILLFFNTTFVLSIEDSVLYQPDFFSQEHLQSEDMSKLEFLDPFSIEEMEANSVEIAAMQKDQKGGSIVLLAFLTSALFFLFFKVFNRQLYVLYRNAFSNYNLFAQLLREKRPSPLIWLMLLLIGRSFVFGVVAYLLIGHFMGEIALRNIGVFFVLFSVFWLLKYLISYFIGVLTNQKSKVRTYYLQHHIIFTGLAAILLPFSFVVYFANDILGNYMVYPLLIISSLGIFYYVSRYFRMVQSYQERSFILFFIYLCAFELMPILVIVKWIGGSISA